MSTTAPSAATTSPSSQRRALELFWADGTFQEELAGKIEALHTGMAKIVEHVKGSYIKGRGFLA